MTPTPDSGPAMNFRKTLMSRTVTAENVVQFEKGRITMSIEANRKITKNRMSSLC